MSDQAYVNNYGPVDTYRGNVTASVSFGHTTNYRYDQTGTLVYTDDGNSSHGLTTTTSNATNYTAPDVITTANSLATRFTWNANLSPLSNVGPNGDQTSASYDPTAGWPTSTTSPYGAVTTYSYSVSAPQITATVDGRWTQTYLDGLGRTARVTKGYGSGSSGTTVSYADTIYDTCGCTPVGKAYKTSLPYVPGSTPVWKTNTYDALGRTLTSVAPDGSSTTSYSYAGNTVTITDPAGNWKQYVTDAFGELAQVIEASPNPSAEPNHVTNYTYDILGHLIQVQMPRTINGQIVTQTRSWTYSSTTQLLSSVTQPETRTVAFTYNGDGTLATKTDAKSQQTQYTYDVYGELTQIARGTVSGGTFTENASQRVNYTYGQQGASNNAAGRPQTITYAGPDGLGITESYQYTPAGDVLNKSLTLGGSALSTTYGYDSEGRVTTIQYPYTTGSPTTYTYGFDSMGRLNTMTDQNSNQLVSGVVYNQADQLLSISGTALNESRIYNANAQLIELVSGVYHYKYNYSTTQNNSRIQSIQDVASGETVVYQYDSLNRLSSATGTGDPQGNWSQTFAYDGFGNLVQKAGNNAPNVTSWTMNPSTNQITSNGAQYDANGNLTAYSGAGTYSYDIPNRMINVIPAIGGSAAYLYDPSNQRVYSKVTAGSTTTEQIYFYGADGRKLQVWSLTVSNNSANLTLVSSNQWFGGRLLKNEDRLQSIGKYFPYGEDRYSPTPANPTGDTEKFATYTQDSATGLNYAMNRYYGSGLGRFTSADTSALHVYLGAPATWNSYAYVDDNPAYGDDPTGLFLEAPGMLSEADLYWDPFFVEYYPYIISNFGGGGSGGAFARALANLANAVQAIHARKTVSADCSKDLAALSKADGRTINLATIQTALASTVFVNGTTSRLPVSALYGPGASAAGAAHQKLEDAQYGKGQTIENDFTRNPNGLTAETEFAGSNIYINPNLIGSNLSNNEGLLFHESIHELGLVDTTIQQALGLAVNPNNTMNITTKLQNDCITEKGNN